MFLTLIKNWRIILGAGLIIALSVSSYRFGKLVAEFEYEEAVNQYREDETRYIIELEGKQNEIDDLKAKGVRRIYVEKDPTGCSDVVVPDGMLSILRETGNKSSTDF